MNVNIQAQRDMDDEISFDLDMDDDSEFEISSQTSISPRNNIQPKKINQYQKHDETIDLDWEDDFEDEEYHTDEEIQEANRLLSLVQSSFPPPPASKAETQSTPELETESVLKGPTTTITSEESLREAKKRRKKLIRNLKQIDKLVEKQQNGIDLNEEQRMKIGREDEWRAELESVEHNLQ